MRRAHASTLASTMGAFHLMLHSVLGQTLQKCDALMLGTGS